MYCKSIFLVFFVILFSVCVTAPGVATNPFPADDAIDVPLDVVLNWTSGTGSAQSDVYFGDSESYAGFYNRWCGGI